MHSCARLALSSLLLLGACSLPDEGTPSTSSAEEAIVGGSSTTEYPAVAQISVTTTGGDSFSCSSTLITPRVLLTAAHCVDLDEGPTESITAYFGSTVTTSDPAFVETIDAEYWENFEPWSLAGNDIALILLEHDSVVEPMPFNDQVLGSGAIGAPLHVIGWGNTSVDVGSGRKREMTTAITGFQSSLVLNYGNSSENTCQGDSGGPGFLTIGGQEKVSSITSFGQQGCLGNSGATRVAHYASYIDSFISERDIPLPPELSITTPMDGQEVHGGFQVVVEASDNTRLDTVEIWINGELKSQMDGRLPPFVIAAPALPDGLVQIEARAYDNRGDMSKQQISVTVDSTCDGPQDCGGLLICGESGTCESPDYGLGDACAGNEECASGLCATVGDDQLCTAECLPGDDSTCIEGYQCLPAGEVGYCWPEDGGSESGGCRAGGRTSGSSALLLFLVLFGLRATAERRRSS
jgi:hypothetical protein